MREVRIRRFSTPQQIIDQERVRKCQKFTKRLLFRTRGMREAAFEIGAQQFVQFAHAAAALPA